jgi:hypothetical protein
MASLGKPDESATLPVPERQPETVRTVFGHIDRSRERVE